MHYRRTQVGRPGGRNTRAPKRTSARIARKRVAEVPAPSANARDELDVDRLEARHLVHYRVVLLPVSLELDVVPCSPAGELLRARAWPEVDPSGCSDFPPPAAEPVLGAAELPPAGGVFMPSRGFVLLLLESDCAPGLTCGLLLSLYRSLQAPTDRPSTANTVNAKIGGLIFPPER